ncbi:interactor of constitutive active ROPs 4-like [Actinidia eriantha]|uniref:interactor of constitutive active ROPs 4-like n=1 Tax=Actinidia eriantha TaxID=165200 RepID=UPI0025836B11|nr:interactor of constitutive active ROPs 4-like [Actinidia eriantha]XP_057461996.1 interactor of constitutive active ROPs 4-like [Actinidia eriantha]
MPRSRGTELPQRRESPRGTQLLKTTRSNSDPLHHRPIPDRSPKLGDHRSPKGPQSDPLNPKKFGTRIADLESQLGQAQEELKTLKEQLASAEEAKKAAQEQLEKKAEKLCDPKPVEVQYKRPPTGDQESKDSIPCEMPDDNQRATDVFEVPMEKATVEEPKVEYSQKIDQQGEETKPSPEPQKPTFEDLELKSGEINLLKAELEEKEKELEVFRQQNESLKSQVKEAALETSACRTKEEEMNSRLSQLGRELEANRDNEVQLKEKLKAVEGAKEALEAEMKKLRVQTEQWRKAADAAAAVLADGVEMNGRRMSERCGSMDKQFGSIFGSVVGGYTGFVGSPGLGDDSDDGFGNGKRKGSGIRMFGDLWKKKGQK